tara:strand:- start:14 stop:988 length:975 start_codon:yes stop_codon:yes gene_type:complete
MTLCILGAGAFGSAMALTLAKSSNKIILWSRSKTLTMAIKKDRENKKYLRNSLFPTNVQITNCLELAVKDASAIIMCIPVQKINNFFKKNHLKIPNVPIVLCSKGIDEKTTMLQSQIIRKFLNKNKIAILTGPSFATELAIGLPTALTIACKSKKTRISLQKSLSTPNLRLYSSSDIIGAQLGGSLKNVIAIGCGMVKGANLGENARTALMTRGLSEIIDLGVAMGANINTFYGLSGLGDLALTCNSMQSRNFTLGLNFNRNTSKRLRVTIEGVKTASAATKLAKKYHVDTPIINTVDQILKQKISLNSSIRALISRPLRKEFI